MLSTLQIPFDLLIQFGLLHPNYKLYRIALMKYAWVIAITFSTISNFLVKICRIQKTINIPSYTLL